MEKQGNWHTLCERIGYFFKDPKLLFEAFTHPSMMVKQPANRKSYQRLEYLGDGVIGLVTREKLFYRFPEATEGELTTYENLLVCGRRLTVVGQRLELGSYLQVVPALEKKEELRKNEYVLACLVESLVGAMFVDCGSLYLSVSQMLEKHLFADMEEVLSADMKDFDPKSFLLELVQRKFKTMPEYKTVSQTGPANGLTWTEAVFIGGHKLAEAQGKSKQEAQKSAASAALTETKNFTTKLPYGLLRMRSVSSDLEFEVR